MGTELKTPSTKDVAAYYRLDPSPPADWLAARIAVKCFVAKQIAKFRPKEKR